MQGRERRFGKHPIALRQTTVTRTARVPVIALALALVWAAPAAAVRPARLVIHLDQGTFDRPPGTFCDFEVTTTRLMDSRLTITDLSAAIG